MLSRCATGSERSQQPSLPCLLLQPLPWLPANCPHASSLPVQVAAAAGTLSCLFIAMAHNYFSLGVIVWDLIIAGNGALAGLVSITGEWVRGSRRPVGE